MAKEKTKKSVIKKSTKAKKPTKSVASKKAKQPKKLEKKLLDKKKDPKFYDQLKLNESYVSLFLGAVVVIAVFSAIFVYAFQSRNEIKEQRVLNSVITPTPKPEQDTYVMQENESLWSVAVRFYGDGFSYTKIVEANPGVITNPDYVPPGTKIIIPDLNK